MAGARVTNVAALEDLKEAVVKFVDDAQVALSAVEMESRRVVDWMTREMPAHWTRQAGIRREEIDRAKADLARKKLQRTDNYKPDTNEEEKALRRAVARFAEAEMKLELIKKWSRRVDQAWDEYQGSAGQLADALTGKPPRCVAELNRMMDALASYLAVAPPPSSESGAGFESAAQPVTMQTAAVEANKSDASAETTAAEQPSAKTEEKAGAEAGKP